MVLEGGQREILREVSPETVRTQGGLGNDLVGIQNRQGMRKGGRWGARHRSWPWSLAFLLKVKGRLDSGGDIWDWAP
jgi:hypothetical protein